MPSRLPDIILLRSAPRAAVDPSADDHEQHPRFRLDIQHHSRALRTRGGDLRRHDRDRGWRDALHIHRTRRHAPAGGPGHDRCRYRQGRPGDDLGAQFVEMVRDRARHRVGGRRARARKHPVQGRRGRRPDRAQRRDGHVCVRDVPRSILSLAARCRGTAAACPSRRLRRRTGRRDHVRCIPRCRKRGKRRRATVERGSGPPRRPVRPALYLRYDGISKGRDVLPPAVPACDRRLGDAGRYPARRPCAGHSALLPRLRLPLGRDRVDDAWCGPDPAPDLRRRRDPASCRTGKGECHSRSAGDLPRHAAASGIGILRPVQPAPRHHRRSSGAIDPDSAHARGVGLCRHRQRLRAD